MLSVSEVSVTSSFLFNSIMFRLTAFLFSPDSANTEQCLLDNADAQAQDNGPIFSSISESL